MTKRLTAEDLAAIADRRAQARANTAIEGVTLTVSQEALFEQFDAEALPHEERRRRIILRVSPAGVDPAE